jgi:hypothetical protein
MHQAVEGLPAARVIANSDMGYDAGRVRNGLPSGCVYSAAQCSYPHPHLRV